jgi:hypothetical protein
MAVDMRLVRKGKGEPRDGLVQQGKVHVTLAKQYEAALIESGWSSEDTAELEKNVALLEVAKASQGDAPEAAESASDPESTAVGEAKVFLRRLRNALPRTLRETRASGVNADVFEAGERFGRSPQKIAAYLTKIRPSVESLDGDLQRHFGGKKASELLDSAKAALDKTGSAEDLASEGLPEETLNLYALKGRVLEGIEDLNRAGRIAFEGQGEVVGKFNKDILLRARREAASSKGAGQGGDTKSSN